MIRHCLFRNAFSFIFINMKTIKFGNTFFNVEDTLTCGQFFAYEKFKQGYLARSLNKFCYCYNSGDSVYIDCNDKDEAFFRNFFDLERDYESLYFKALSENLPFLNLCVEKGKGIRILKQPKTENLITFMISQNNNIPRIKNSVKYLCEKLGETVEFNGNFYHAFPDAEKLARQDLSFFKDAGLGYRAEYLKELCQKLADGLDLEKFSLLSSEKLKDELLKIKGVGEKVASCVMLFSYSRFDSFPVDTWIEKIYRENFDGKLTDRKKISSFFIDKFGEESGIIQQYMFHYKRNLERGNK